MFTEELFKRECLNHACFMRSLANVPNNLALTIVEPDGTYKDWTYKELNREINKLAHALQEDGIKKGDVIMSSLPYYSAEGVLAGYSVPKIGAIYAPADFRLTSDVLANFLDFLEPKIYIYGAELEAAVKGALGSSRHKPQRMLSVAEFASYTKGKSEEEPVSDVTPFDVGIIHHTAGTTGVPKWCTYNHITLWLTGIMASAMDGWGPGFRVLSLYPLFHRAGLGAVTFIQSTGGHAFGMSQFAPAVALDAIEKRKINFLFSTPFFIDAMIFAVREGEKKGKKWDVSSLKGIDPMGAPLSRESYLNWQKYLGVKEIFNSGGHTETSWPYKLSPRYSLPEKFETEPFLSIGTTNPYYITRAVKIYPDRKAVPDDLIKQDGIEIGEMITKSPCVVTGYYKLPEKTEEAFPGEWFYTGDIVTWDKDGYFMYRGRKEDIIPVKETAFAEEIEAMIIEHPKVRACIVAGAPDEIEGQVVAAYVVPEDPSLTIEELNKHCLEHPKLAAHPSWRPRYYKFIDEVPVTSAGKKMHYVMKERVERDLEGKELKRV
jgi:acyl-coenzyme A synthetase/AMP-(fatty) acid ligase